MEKNILKTLVHAVATTHVKHLDANCSTCIGMYDELKKITRKSLWENAENYDYYTESDIPSESDRREMEDMWARYIEAEVACDDDSWKMK